MAKLKKFLQEAVDNVRSDRKKAASLLDDIAEYIGQNQNSHKDVGIVAAKYLETLQRSNEQLVKLTALVQKDQDDEYGELSVDEVEDLFSQFEEEISEESCEVTNDDRQN